MLRDLFDTAGVDVGDADQRRVYLVCLECAKQPFFSLEYTDLFLGRTVHILFNQHNQIEAPMKLIDAAARLHLSLDHPAGDCSFSIRRHSASLKLWPAQRIRVMFGCTATACHRLAIAPASLNLHSKKSTHFKTRILVRVMGGYLSKVQVQQQLLLHCRVATTPSHVILYFSNASQQTRDTRKFFGFDDMMMLCSARARTCSRDCSPIPLSQAAAAPRVLAKADAAAARIMLHAYDANATKYVGSPLPQPSASFHVQNLHHFPLHSLASLLIHLLSARLAQPLDAVFSNRNASGLRNLTP
jgi:hypothetical protein